MKTVLLGDVCSVFTDGDWIESKDQSIDGIRLVQTGNVGIGQFKDRAEKARYISESTFQRLRCEEVLTGDCLISRLPDPVGRSCLIPEHRGKFITAVDCTIIRFKDEIDPNYFIYYSQSKKYLNDVAQKCTGTTRNRISKKNLAEISIPAYSLKEQRRIVEKLDEVFAAIDKAKANTEKNLKNSQELFESELFLVFEELLKEKAVELGEVSRIIGGGTPAKNNPAFYNGSIPWATVRDMNVEIIKDTQFQITQDAVKKSSTNVAPTQSVIIATRVGLGKVCLLTQDTAINQDLRAIIPNEALDRDFLYWWLKSQSQVIKDKGVGATVKGVKLPFIKGLRIPLPPVHNQNLTALRLKGLYDKTQKLQKLHQQKLDDLAELRQSLLKQAFEGKL